ncbi:AAA family ATPase [Bacteriovoracaceae bacterium]|nr:AAA family ATPase [Bacteriovoracaceae bacterium]
MGLFFKSKSKDNSETLQNSAKVIAFLNQKGGVGKTTMAFNTASALANQNYKVLCLDMDPQGNLSQLLGVDVDETDSPQAYNLLINSIRELKGLHSPVLFQDVLVKGKLDLIPSGQALSGFELSVAGINSPRQLILKRMLEKTGILSQYDYVVIDGPPTLGLLVVNILCACDGVMVPFRPDEFSRKGLGNFYDVLGQIEEMGVTKIPQVLAHIPNLVDLRRKQEGVDLKRITQDLEDEFGQGNVVAPFLNKAPLVRSQAQKKSVFDYQSKEFTPLQGQFDQLAHLITSNNKWEMRSEH